MVLANVVWFLVSRSPLVVLTAAVLLGAEEPIVVRVQRLRQRVGGAASAALTVVIALAGLALLLDLAVLAASGDWLFE